MWTCNECGCDYDSNTGDTDERLCHECIDGERDDDSVQLTARVEIVYRTQSIRVDCIFNIYMPTDRLIS